MKKTTLLLLLPMLIFTACQKTPESAIVVSKSEGIGNYAPATKDAEANDDPYEYIYPNSYEATIRGSNPIVTINVSATVRADAQAHRGIYSVKPALFTQAQVDNAISVFMPGIIPGETLYNINTMQTKQEILEEIQLYAQAKDALIKEDPNFDPSGHDEMIKALQEQLATAPESLVRTPNDGKFTEEADAPMAQNSKNRVEAAANLGSSKDALLSIYRSDDGVTGYMRFDHHSNGMPVLNYQPAKDLDTMNLTLEQAKQSAKEILVDMGLEQMAFSCAYTTKLTKGENPAFDQQCYILLFTPAINGAPASYLTPMRDSTNAAGHEPRYVPTWGTEYVYMAIGGEGLIEFEHVYPSSLGEQIIADVELLPFDALMETFAQQIKIAEAWPYDEITLRTVQIDEIILSYCKLDGGAKGYVYAPVWDFVGSVYEEQKVQGETVGYTQSRPLQSFLTLNAIDGSVVERMVMSGSFKP